MPGAGHSGAESIPFCGAGEELQVLDLPLLTAPHLATAAAASPLPPPADTANPSPARPPARNDSSRPARE